MECRPHVVVQYSAEHNSGSSEPFSVWHLCSAVVRCARVAACCCAYTLRPITLAPGQSHLVAQASTNLPSQHHQCRIAIGDIPPQVTPSFITRVATGGAIAIRAKNQGQDLGLDDHKKFSVLQRMQDADTDRCVKMIADQSVLLEVRAIYVVDVSFIFSSF